MKAAAEVIRRRSFVNRRRAYKTCRHVLYTGKRPSDVVPSETLKSCVRESAIDEKFRGPFVYAMVNAGGESQRRH